MAPFSYSAATARLTADLPILTPNVEALHKDRSVDLVTARRRRLRAELEHFLSFTEASNAELLCLTARILSLHAGPVPHAQHP